MCEYCHKKIKNKKIQDIDNDNEDSAEIVIQHKNLLYIELNGKDENGYKTCDFFEINYCPMCGRKLGE